MTNDKQLLLRLKDRYRTWSLAAERMGITKSYMSKLVAGTKPLTSELRLRAKHLVEVNYFAHTAGSQPIRWVVEQTNGGETE